MLPTSIERLTLHIVAIDYLLFVYANCCRKGFNKCIFVIRCCRLWNNSFINCNYNYLYRRWVATGWCIITLLCRHRQTTSICFCMLSIVDFILSLSTLYVVFNPEVFVHNCLKTETCLLVGRIPCTSVFLLIYISARVSTYILYYCFYFMLLCNYVCPNSWRNDFCICTWRVIWQKMTVSFFGFIVRKTAFLFKFHNYKLQVSFVHLKC